jgi:hypothetical protein
MGISFYYAFVIIFVITIVVVIVIDIVLSLPPCNYFFFFKNNLLIQIWAEKLLSMYSKWAKKQGYIGRVVEKYPSKSGGIKSATIEFEFECAYGYLLGEKGVHDMIGSQNGSALHEV